jgi:thiosulfate/3-mercaptopyruvate sulfurtransferase
MTPLAHRLTATLFALGLNFAHAATLPGPLVDAAWLAGHLDQVQVVDVRSNVKSYTTAPEFDTDAKTGKKTLSEVGGHIAGSRLIDMKTMRTDRQVGALKVKYMIPLQADFEKAVRAAGVSADKPMVLVPVGSDVADVDEALRVYWQLKVYGEDNIAVLDGGMANWLAEGRPVSTDAAPTQTGSWSAKADRSAQYFAGTDDVSKAIAEHSATLVDSRDDKQFHGLTKRDYVGAYGHLEGAKLYPTDLMFKTAGGAVKFMSPATYSALLSAQGIDPKAPAITYCNSGHLSSGPWFLMSEVLGNHQTRLYDGSLHEWTMEQHTLAGAVPLN